MRTCDACSYLSFVDALSSIMSGSGLCVPPLIGGNGHHGFYVSFIFVWLSNKETVPVFFKSTNGTSSSIGLAALLLHFINALPQARRRPKISRSKQAESFRGRQNIVGDAIARSIVAAGGFRAKTISRFSMTVTS